VIALTLLVIAAAGLGVALVKVRAALAEADARAQDQRAAIRVAAAYIVGRLSLDYHTVDQDMRRVLAISTGQAKAGYLKNAPALRRATIDNKAVQQGALRAAGLVTMSPARDSAEVLVVADGAIHWDKGKVAPQQRFYRWHTTLAKVDGAWRVAGAEQVP
jgi:Mce-associated membrane protein